MASFFTVVTADWVCYEAKAVISSWLNRFDRLTKTHKNRRGHIFLISSVLVVLKKHETCLPDGMTVILLKKLPKRKFDKNKKREREREGGS